VTALSHSRSSSTSSVYTQVLVEDAFIFGVISSKQNPNKFFDTSVAEDGFGEDQPSFRYKFSWRQDPDDSLSDWTIEITGTFEDDSKKLAFHTYHVHKCKLGAGPRRSKYFQSLFSTAAHLSEHQEQTSRIELLEAEVSSFERMLDFMYGLESDDVVTTANAVVMRYLAFYFQCAALMMQVNSFLGHDLVPANGPHYLLEATKYQDQRLQISAANVCSAHVDKLPKDDLNGLPMELFQRILRSSDITCSSITLSMVVANYLDYHSDEVNAAVIVDMTKDLDKFDEGASQIIMGMVRKLNPREDVISWKSLESIVVRCARATNWQTMDAKALRASFEHDWVTDFDYHQATAFATIRAAAALKSAQRDYEDVIARKDAELSALQEENSELQFEKNTLVAEISSLADEIDQLRSQLEWSKISADGGRRTYRDSTVGGRGRRYLANFRGDY
jgi:hypothetical protein